MEKRYKIIWKGQEAGPYTLEQIQMMLDSRQIGLAHQVVMDGKRVLMGDFLKFLESEQQQVAQQAELKRLEEERQAKHARQLDMIKAQESQRESEHRREMEVQQVNAPPPALPSQPPQPGYSPQPVAAEADGNSAAKAGGGFALFVIVVLGVLWYQGYWSPSGILEQVSSVLDGSKVTKVTIKAGEATITDKEDDGLSHLKLECNNGLVIDVDWKRNPLNDFGYDIHEPVINMTYNRLAVMMLARGVIASYLNGKYD